MTMYAIGDAKYERSSLSAIARILRIDVVSFDGRRGSHVVCRQRKEYLFEAHAHRPELEQPPAVGDDRLGEIAPHVTPAFAFDFEADETIPAIGFADARDAGDAAERACGHCRVRARHV